MRDGLAIMPVAMLLGAVLAGLPIMAILVLRLAHGSWGELSSYALHRLVAAWLALAAVLYWQGSRKQFDWTWCAAFPQICAPAARGG